MSERGSSRAANATRSCWHCKTSTLQGHLSVNIFYLYRIGNSIRQEHNLVQIWKQKFLFRHIEFRPNKSIFVSKLCPSEVAIELENKMTFSLIFFFANSLGGALITKVSIETLCIVKVRGCGEISTQESIAKFKTMGF